VNLTAIQTAEGFARVGLLDDAAEALVGTEESKLRYLDLANTVQRFYKAVLPDSAAREFAVEVIPVQVIADKIRALIPPADISLVMRQVESLLDRSIATEGYVIR
jgi:type I restriction enzyme, R subunit